MGDEPDQTTHYILIYKFKDIYIYIQYMSICVCVSIYACNFEYMYK